MTPDWTPGPDPAITRGFGHGDAYADGLAPESPSEPMLVPGLEPVSDGAAGTSAVDPALSDLDFATASFPELNLGTPTPPAESNPAAPAFPSVQAAAPAPPASPARPEERAKKRRGLFGRRRKDDAPAATSAPAATPAPPVPGPATPTPFAPVADWGTAPAEDPYAAPASYDTGGETPGEATYVAPPSTDSAPTWEASTDPVIDASPAYDAPEEPTYDPAPTGFGADTPVPDVAADGAAAPSPFDDWTVAPALPTEIDEGGGFDVVNVDSSYAEPQAYEIPDVAENPAPAESFEVNYDVAGYGDPSSLEFAAPGAPSLETPVIESVPMGDDGFGAAPEEPVAPTADAPVPQDAAVDAGEVEATPEWQPVEADVQPMQDAIPMLEPDPEPEPAPEPPPAPEPLPAPEPPLASEPAFAAGPEPMPVDSFAAPYGEPPAYPAPQPYDTAAAYGEPAGQYSPDQFAQPYGWEAAGANALEAAGYEPDYRGYAPEAFSAPPPTEDYEADVANAVFSELRSLSSERPTIQKTKAGLARRERSAVATAAPVDEAESKAVERDPETVRANFAGFYTGTARGRADAAVHPTDVHGVNNEVTP